MKAPIFVITTLLFPAFANAADWICKPDIEIQCTSDNCAVASNQDEIPITLTFDSRGTFSLCAYAGCWEGKGRVLAKSPFFIIAAKAVDWSDPNQRTENREDVLIALSAKDKMATVMAGSLAMPMRCGP